MGCTYHVLWVENKLHATLSGGDVATSGDDRLHRRGVAQYLAIKHEHGGALRQA